MSEKHGNSAEADFVRRYLKLTQLHQAMAIEGGTAKAHYRLPLTIDGESKMYAFLFSKKPIELSEVGAKGCSKGQRRAKLKKEC